MKKSIIKEVFHGIGGTVHSMKMTEEGRRLLSVVTEAHDAFAAQLTPQQLELHRACLKAQTDECIEEADLHYVEGFKLGLLIGIECMEK